MKLLTTNALKDVHAYVRHITFYDCLCRCGAAYDRAKGAVFPDYIWVSRFLFPFWWCFMTCVVIFQPSDFGLLLTYLYYVAYCNCVENTHRILAYDHFKGRSYAKYNIIRIIQIFVENSKRTSNLHTSHRRFHLETWWKYRHNR